MPCWLSTMYHLMFSVCFYNNINFIVKLCILALFVTTGITMAATKQFCQSQLLLYTCPEISYLLCKWTSTKYISFVDSNHLIMVHEKKLKLTKSLRINNNWLRFNNLSVSQWWVMKKSGSFCFLPWWQWHGKGEPSVYIYFRVTNLFLGFTKWQCPNN